MWYSGIDQHKRDSVITTYGLDGASVKQARVPNTAVQLARYFGQFPGPHRAVVESTGGGTGWPTCSSPLGSTSC